MATANAHQQVLATSSIQSQSFSPDKEVGSSVHKCPAKGTQDEVPCNLLTFQLKDATSGRRVSCSGKVASMHPQDATKAALADGYDMVLETVSTFPVEGAGLDSKKTAVLVPTLTYEGDCPLHRGFTVSATPSEVSEGDTLPGPETIVAQCIGLVTYGKTLPIDLRNNAFPSWATFKGYFEFGEGTVKSIELVAVSCGITPQGKPLHRLTALARIYRDDSYQLKLQLPPWKIPFEYSKSGEGLGSKDASYKDKHSGDPREFETASDGTNKSVKTTTGYLLKDVITVDEKGKSGKKQLDVTLSLQRNGQDLPFSELANQLVRDIMAIRTQFLTAITDFQNCVPRVGFSFRVSVSVLEGSLSASWGYRADTRYDSESCKWVSRYFDLTIDITALKCSLEFSFGVEASSPAILNWWGGKAFELVAKIALTLSAALQVKKTYTLAGDSSSDSSDPKGAIIADVAVPASLDCSLQFKVTVTGHTLQAQGGVEAGVEFTCRVLREPINVKIAAERKPGLLYAFWNRPGKAKPAPRWEYELWSSAPLLQGKYLFGD